MIKTSIIKFIFFLSSLLINVFKISLLQAFLDKRFNYVVTRGQLHQGSIHIKGANIPVNREEAAYIVYNKIIINYKAKVFKEFQCLRFIDDRKISYYAKNAIKKLSVIGGLSGEEGKFYPERLVQRSVLEEWQIKFNKYCNELPSHSPEFFEGNIPVLMYHHFKKEQKTDEPWLFCKPNDFNWQIRYLVENGFTFLFADEICYADCYDKPVIITADDGYLDNYTNAYPIIKKYNAKMTIFVTSGQLNTKCYISEEQAREMSVSNNISIQSHTVSHPRLADQSVDVIERELFESKKKLELIINKDVTCIAYPHGSFNDKVISITQKYYNYGYAIGNSIPYSNENKYRIRRLEITQDTEYNKFINLIRGDHGKQ